MSGINDFYVHSCVVETFQGSGAYGDVYAAPVTDVGFLQGATKLVRSSTGQQVVSSSQFFTDPANKAHYTPDSKFTDPSGHVSHVIGVNVNDSGVMGLPDHVQVNLT